MLDISKTAVLGCLQKQVVMGMSEVKKFLNAVRVVQAEVKIKEGQASPASRDPCPVLSIGTGRPLGLSKPCE